MKFEPRTLDLGIIDFFSIMLPGAVVAYWAKVSLLPQWSDPFIPLPVEGAQGWIVFVFASYLIGHFVFLVGSWLDKIYDPVRAKVWPRSKDHAFREAAAIKEKYVGDHSGREVINSFQWAKARLSIQCPRGLAAVERLEADSKFFRSLVVVFFVLCFSFFWNKQPASGWLCLALIALSFWRYVERRQKSTEQAYRYIITLEGLPSDAPGWAFAEKSLSGNEKD